MFKEMNKYRYSLVLIFGLVSFSTVYSQTAHELLREGDESYEKANYAMAEEDYRKASEEETTYKSEYNLANTLYKQDRFEEASQLYQSALNKMRNEELKAQAYHNLGNSLFNEQKLKESIDAYKEALRINPEDMDTKYNLQKTKQLVKMMEQQQQQQQQQNQDQNENQDNQDQQEQQQQDTSEQKENEEEKQDQSQEEKDKEEQEDQKNQEENSDEKSASDQNESTNTGEEDKQTLDREDALKLLQVIENEEKKVQEKLHRVKDGGKKPEKDW